MALPSIFGNVWRWLFGERIPPEDTVGLRLLISGTDELGREQTQTILVNTSAGEDIDVVIGKILEAIESGGMDRWFPSSVPFSFESLEVAATVEGGFPNAVLIA